MPNPASENRSPPKGNFHRLDENHQRVSDVTAKRGIKTQATQSHSTEHIPSGIPAVDPQRLAHPPQADAMARELSSKKPADNRPADNRPADNRPSVDTTSCADRVRRVDQADRLLEQQQRLLSMHAADLIRHLQAWQEDLQKRESRLKAIASLVNRSSH